jgi:hypothetical protein
LTTTMISNRVESRVCCTSDSRHRRIEDVEGCAGTTTDMDIMGTNGIDLHIFVWRPRKGFCDWPYRHVNSDRVSTKVQSFVWSSPGRPVPWDLQVPNGASVTRPTAAAAVPATTVAQGVLVPPAEAGDRWAQVGHGPTRGATEGLPRTRGRRPSRVRPAASCVNRSGPRIGVTFTGRVPHDDVERFYSLVDIGKPLPVAKRSHHSSRPRRCRG